MKPDDKPVEGKKNDPMMPVAWTKTYKGESGKTGRVFTTTMGAATDLESEGTRRMLVNACFWAMGLEDKIPDKGPTWISSASTSRCPSDSAATRRASSRPTCRGVGFPARFIRRRRRSARRP